MFLMLLIPLYATPPDRISFIHAEKIKLKLYRILNISCTDQETKVQPNPGMFSILWIIMSSKPFFFLSCFTFISKESRGNHEQKHVYISCIL